VEAEDFTDEGVDVGEALGDECGPRLGGQLVPVREAEFGENREEQVWVV
jgi:hypothetical protein